MSYERVEMFCHGPCECFDCNKRWIGVWPLDAEALECPECESTDTLREFE